MWKQQHRAMQENAGPSLATKAMLNCPFADDYVERHVRATPNPPKSRPGRRQSPLSYRFWPKGKACIEPAERLRMNLGDFNARGHLQVGGHHSEFRALERSDRLGLPAERTRWRQMSASSQRFAGSTGTAWIGLNRFCCRCFDCFK